MEAPDYRRLFDAAPCAYLVLLPDLTIVAVSDAYLGVTMTKRADLVGKPLFAAFPDDPRDPAADGVAQLRASIGRVLLEKRAQRMPITRYSIRRPESEGGAFEERYWKPLNVPVLGDLGQLDYIIHYVEDVTDVVQLQRDRLERDRRIDAISAHSHKLEQWLDAAPDATVIIGPDARIRAVNIGTEQMFGYERAELVGKPLDILIPERFRTVHREHMARYLANPVARPMGGVELFGRRRDASEVPIDVNLSPQHGAEELTVVAAIRDISERRRLEAHARLTADRLASAVDAMQDAFALFDAEDRLILCNSVFRRLHHQSSSGALVGRSYLELLDAWLEDVDFPDAEARRRFRDERLKSRREDQSAVFDVRMRDGRKLRVIDRRTPEHGIVKTVWDLTDDERLLVELREARALADAANAAKSEFLSAMSHELRTPLNAILGFAQLMRRDRKEPLSERHKERVGHILQGGEHLLRLIDDVLDLARIESKRVSLSTEVASLAELVREAVQTLQPMADAHQLTLRTDLGGQEALEVSVDRRRFLQILMNYGSNAIKYNRPRGDVYFEVSRPNPDRVRVRVRDTGNGIPSDKQALLFQPFQRSGQEAGPIEGTGIGLVITKQLAELMAGEVGFSSAEGQGSEFWVEVPVAELREQTVLRAPRVEPSFAAPADYGKRLVLYVEDNAANVSLMRDLMSTFDNVDLLTAASAETGVALSRERRPHVIIMDINLPGLSGLHAMRLLQAQPETRDLPIIALTAAATDREREEGMAAGFYRYMTKPIEVAELMSVMQQLFAR